MSVFVKAEGIGSPSTAALVISISTFASTLLNLVFAPIYARVKDWILPIGFFFCALGFLAITGIASLAALIIGEILIGIALGLLFPYFPLKVIEKTSPEETTGALAVLSSAFSIGMFLSPIFFFGADNAPENRSNSRRIPAGSNSFWHWHSGYFGTFVKENSYRQIDLQVI